MNMDNRKRRDLGMAYISDDAVMEEQKRCRRLMQKLNAVAVSYTHLDVYKRQGSRRLPN